VQVAVAQLANAKLGVILLVAMRSELEALAWASVVGLRHNVRHRLDVSVGTVFAAAQRDHLPEIVSIMLAGIISQFD
jgi:hypothetical protein